MNFNPTSEQQEMRKKLAALGAEKIAPAAVDTDSKGEFDSSIWSALADAGVLGLMIPEANGGAGKDILSGVLAIEEISVSCASVGMAAATSMFCAAKAIEIYGSESVRKKYLPQLANGSSKGTFATTEANAGSDLSAIQTTAVKDGDSWVINGEKTYATNGANADIAVVLAKTGDSFSLFLVPLDAKGAARGAKIQTMGLRGSGANSLKFADCRIPAENLLGAEGAGMAAANDILDYFRLAVSAVAAGVARSAYTVGKEFAETRVAFGKQIGKYQEIAFKVTDLHVDSDYARQLMYHAAWQKQEGMKCDTMIAAAKVAAGEVAVANADRAVSILGGKGCIQGETSERLYRDSRHMQIAGGTPEVLRQMIAVELLAE